jgi:hypothetical protein
MIRQMSISRAVFRFTRWKVPCARSPATVARKILRHPRIGFRFRWRHRTGLAARRYSWRMAVAGAPRGTRYGVTFDGQRARVMTRWWRVGDGCRLRVARGR